MVDQEAVMDAIYEADGIRFGEFELSHGGESSYYIDKYRFETDPQSLSVIAEAFAELAGDRLLAGVALGAVPLVTATSLSSGSPYAIVRKATKEYGTAKRIEGIQVAGQTVVLLEDVATTGTSALEAVEALREAGATVTEVLVVVDRGQGARDLLANAGVTLTALVSADDLLNHRTSIE